jgi:2-polyprenyl-3-methyl-5-hydroxy-6-metoxy-1,4-benzoquinol methylase
MEHPQTQGTLECPVCGAAARLAFRHPDADLYRCRACDHCFSDVASMRSEETYDASYYDEVHRNWFEHPHVWLFDQIRRRVGQLGPAPSVLDVGCGRGDFLRWLHDAEPAWELTGIDLSANAPHAGITLLQGDVMNQLLSRRYDAVVNLAVIEHVADVRRFTGVLRSCCRPGGLIVIMTINDRSVLYSMARVARRAQAPAAFDRLYERHHLNHFNVRSLRRLVESQGLTVVETLRHDIPMNAVDMPPAGLWVTAVRRFGVRAAFLAGRLTGRTYLQTLVCRAPGRSGSGE